MLDQPIVNVAPGRRDDLAVSAASGVAAGVTAGVADGALDGALDGQPSGSAGWRDDDHVPASVRVAKRGLDILIAALALVLTLPLWPLIALAIRVESPGPVIFRQLRIGTAAADRTKLFMMLKFRSMRQDAEAGTGAVWATRNDARVTRVGRFLRKTRLDELPQLINVLRGDMSIVGPRPERPGLYEQLERAIPFFAERTIGLRPGITGFAQAVQGYDASLDDVRRKVSMDHAYAMRMHTLRSWIRLDLWVMARTIAVMLGRRGQ